MISGAAVPRGGRLRDRRGLRAEERLRAGLLRQGRHAAGRDHHRRRQDHQDTTAGRMMLRDSLNHKFQNATLALIISASVSVTDVLFLKHGSRILRQSSNPLCGFLKSQASYLCAKQHTA